jgi:hypothetical protein
MAILCRAAKNSLRGTLSVQNLRALHTRLRLRRLWTQTSPTASAPILTILQHVQQSQLILVRVGSVKN